jgi:hypothetical protein
MGNGGITPSILNLGTKWVVVSFMPRTQLSPRLGGKRPIATRWIEDWIIDPPKTIWTLWQTDVMSLRGVGQLSFCPYPVISSQGSSRTVGWERYDSANMPRWKNNIKVGPKENMQEGFGSG